MDFYRFVEPRLQENDGNSLQCGVKLPGNGKMGLKSGNLINGVYERERERE